MIEKINWRITFNCNMRPYCNYCFMPHSEHRDDMLVKSIFEKILLYNPKMVVISGGEPLMCKSISDIIKSFYSKGIKVCLATNGILLLTKFPDYFKYIHTLTLPIDFLRDYKYRNVVSQKSVKYIMEHLRNLSLKGVDIPRLIINTMFYEQTISELISIAKFISYYNVDVWKIFEYIHYEEINKALLPYSLKQGERELLNNTFVTGKLSYEDSINKDSRYFIINPDGRIMFPMKISQNKFEDIEIGTIHDETSLIEHKWHNMVNNDNVEQSNSLLNV